MKVPVSLYEAWVGQSVWEEKTKMESVKVSIRSSGVVLTASLTEEGLTRRPAAQTLKNSGRHRRQTSMKFLRRRN